MKKLVLSAILAAFTAAASSAPPAPYNDAFGRLDVVVSAPRTAVGTAFVVLEENDGLNSKVYNCAAKVTTEESDAAQGNFPVRQHIALTCGADGYLYGVAYPDFLSQTIPATKYSSAEVEASVDGYLTNRSGVRKHVTAVLNLKYLANHKTGVMQYDVVSGEVYW